MDADLLLHSHYAITDVLLLQKFWQRDDLFELIFEYADKATQDRWRQFIDNSFVKGTESQAFTARHAIGKLFESKSSAAQEHGKAMIRYEISKYVPKGDGAEDIRDAWLESTKKDNMPRIIAKNLSAIRLLEQKEPGIVQRLYEEFGIRDFARYPEELLISQDKNQKDIQQPYGIVIYPRNDHNGAFYIYGAIAGIISRSSGRLSYPHH